MEDFAIIELYWQRSEQAIEETRLKYGRYCRTIAQNILHSEQDCEECLNDTWLKAWNRMPPQRPQNLTAFLGRITRSLALDRFRLRNAQKRSGGQAALALEELQECLPAFETVEQAWDDAALTELLNRFLAGLAEEPRTIFVQRYWYLCPVRQIAAGRHISESKVKMTLLRTRQKLKLLLEQEGFGV